MRTQRSNPSQIVHLELHTGDRARASTFYERLLHWRPELIRSSCGSYLAFEPGGRFGGGIVECATRRPLWLPYVEVARIEECTERARQLGAAVLLEPREGPAGWRSVVSSPEGGEVAVLGAEAMTRQQTRRAGSARADDTASERQLLAAARAGDEDAFAQLVAPYRVQLHAHCYRMLGSVPDAEDALQETLLRAWRALPGFESRSSLRSWLYTIVTNACLRAIERRPARVLPIDYAPAADPHDGPAEPVTESVWLEPYPDETLGLEGGLLGPDARYEQREGIELAFAAALQHLPPRQRAVLILRDVLGFSARETADALETTPVSIDSALQRAHKAVDARVPKQSQQTTLRQLGDVTVRDLVDRYVAAWERNDVDALVALLADDARMTMPPLPSWYAGRDAIRAFLRGWPFSGAKRWRLVPARANAQLAFGGYTWDEETRTFRPHEVSVLTLRGAEIEEITAFLTPDAFARFGLPDLIPA